MFTVEPQYAPAVQRTDRLATHPSAGLDDDCECSHSFELHISRCEAPEPQLDSSTRQMSTASLLAYLRCAGNVAPKSNPKTLYKTLVDRWLTQSITLQPLEADLPPLHLSPLAVLRQFGTKVELKGGAAEQALQAERRMSGMKLNDLDFAIAQKNLNVVRIRRRLVECLMRGKIARSPSGAEQLTAKTRLHAIDPDALVRGYCRNWLEGNGFVKFRLNMREAETPIDIVLYKQLAANFDSLHASTVIEIDFEQQSATAAQVIASKTQDWLASEDLLWLHDDMDNGLSRVQKHLTKRPNLSLLQSEPIIEQLYQRDTRTNQANFVCWLLANKPKPETGWPKPLLLLAAQLQAQLASHHGPGDHWTQTELQSQLEVLLANLACAVDKQSCLNEVIAALANCLRFAPICSKEFAQFLTRETLWLDRLAPEFDQFFKRPGAARVLKLWQSEAARSNEQIGVLLLSISHALEQNASKFQALALQFHVQNLSRKPIQAQVLKDLLAAPEHEHWVSRTTVIKQLFAAIEAADYAAVNERALKSRDAAIGCLEPRDLMHGKNLQPLYQRLSASEFAQLSIKAPRLSQLLAYLKLRDQIKHNSLANNKTIEWAQTRADYQQVLEQFEALLPWFDALQGDMHEASWLSQAGPAGAGFWFEVGGRHCVMNEIEVYVGQTSRSGKRKEVRYHGDGLLYNRSQRSLIMAKFAGSEVNDANTRMCWPFGYFQLGIKNGQLAGEGTLDVAPSEPNVAAILQILDPYFIKSKHCKTTQTDVHNKQATTSAMPAYDQDLRVTGEWVGRVTDLLSNLSNPLQPLQKGLLYWPAAGLNNRAGVEAFGVRILDGEPRSAQVQGYRYQQQFTLMITPAQGQRGLSQSDVAMGLRQPLRTELFRTDEFDSRVILESAQCNYDLDERTLRGTALVESIDFAYRGDFVGLKPQGYGQVCFDGDLIGRRVWMEQGVEFDHELNDFVKGNWPAELADRSEWADYFLLKSKNTGLAVRPFRLPAQGAADCQISYLNDNGDKVIGLWHASTITGLLRKQEPSASVCASRFKVVKPQELAFVRHAVERTARLHQGKAIDEQVRQQTTFLRSCGQQAVLVPHGPTSQHDVALNKSSVCYHAFGVELGDLQYYATYEGSHLFRGTKQADRFVLSVNASEFYDIMLPDSGGDSARTIAKRLGSEQCSGVIVSNFGTYEGDMQGLTPYGQGLQRMACGTEIAGDFKQLGTVLGTMRFKNNLEIIGTWYDGLLSDTVTLVIPQESGTGLTVSRNNAKVYVMVEMRGDKLLANSTVYLPNAQHIKFQSGPLNICLASFGLALSPAELRHLTELGAMPVNGAERLLED